MSNLTIAIDGPASSGKSTIAKILAQKLGLIYIDTGAMYRAITLAIVEEGLKLSNTESLAALLGTIDLSFVNEIDGQRILLNGQDVSFQIREKRINEQVSDVAALKIVRDKLVNIQRQMAENHSVVMDGRDIGTVVLPNADFKFYLTASVKERARRRYEENLVKGFSTESLEEIEAAIQKRDYIDMNRELNPLVQADDAISIDTSHSSIEEIVSLILAYISNKKNPINKGI